MADPKLSDSQKGLQQRMFPPGASTEAWQQRELEKLGQRKDQEQLEKIKKGSQTVPSYCKGGKVIKSWGK